MALEKDREGLGVAGHVVGEGAVEIENHAPRTEIRERNHPNDFNPRGFALGLPLHAPSRAAAPARFRLRAKR